MFLRCFVSGLGGLLMQQSSVGDNLLMSCFEHWWMPQDKLSFMALQTNRSIPID
jgi:hypothetical protein